MRSRILVPVQRVPSWIVRNGGGATNRNRKEGKKGIKGTDSENVSRMVYDALSLSLSGCGAAHREAMKRLPSHGKCHTLFSSFSFYNTSTYLRVKRKITFQLCTYMFLSIRFSNSVIGRLKIFHKSFYKTTFCICYRASRKFNTFLTLWKYVFIRNEAITLLIVRKTTDVFENWNAWRLQFLPLTKLLFVEYNIFNFFHQSIL